MKRCSACKQLKPLSEYTKRKVAKDGYNSACKSCTRKRCHSHFVENKEYYRRKTRKQNRIRRREIQTYMREQKAVPCKDCGESYHFCVMDFDHVRGKKLFMISEGGYAKTLSQVKKEVAKCDVVCANCHRLRTYMRAHSSTG